MFFTLPVFLLFLRLTVNLLFTSMYRLWCKTKDGIETLEQVSTFTESCQEGAEANQGGRTQQDVSALSDSPP